MLQWYLLWISDSHTKYLINTGFSFPGILCKATIHYTVGYQILKAKPRLEPFTCRSPVLSFHQEFGGVYVYSNVASNHPVGYLFGRVMPCEYIFFLAHQPP
jgi:hypothetical protein